MALKKRRLWVDPDFHTELGVVARRSGMNMIEFTKEMKPLLTDEFGKRVKAKKYLSKKINLLEDLF